MSGSATADALFAALCDQLAAGNAVPAVSSDFAQLSDDRARVQFAHELLLQQGLLPRSEVSARFQKDDVECSRLKQQADKAIHNGNKLRGALQLYTRAVAHGLVGGENLGKAYIGRSDILFKLGHFDKCTEDLQLASECANVNTDQIKSKLNECASAAVVAKTKLKRADTEEIPRITHSANCAIACASDAVTIKKTIDCGRFVAATKDIQIGEVIAVEKPFVANLLSDPDVSTTHCHQCLQMNYGPIPCDHCTFAMYCSTKCKSHAWKHHQFECPITGALQDFELPQPLTPIAIRLAIVVAPQYDVIETYSTECDILEERYESDRYKEIHNLCTNTSLRRVADLFRRAVNAALIYELVERHTTFFTTANDLDTNKNREIFKGLLLRHMQTGPSNFHTIGEKLLSADGSGEPGCIDIGSGAYSFLSMLNHSCTPNVVRSWYGSTTVLRALRLIRKGEQLFDNYGMHFAVTPKRERQQELKSQYLFDCNCRACIEDWPLYPDLKVFEDREDVSFEEIEALTSADRDGIVKILEALIVKARALQNVVPPVRNVESLQECIKECYSRLGNKRVV